MITITTCLWDANDHSPHFSRCYTEDWADKLYRGCKRNLTQPFRFVVFTDRDRRFAEPAIEQERLLMADPHFGACIEPYRLNCAQIMMGLDTVIVGNIDHLAAHALQATRPAVPRDPFYPETVTNSIVIAPDGCERMLWDGYAGQNDMNWVRAKQAECDLLDDLFPRQVVSYKGRVQYVGIEDETRIVFFHGVRKPHELTRQDFIREHWLGLTGSAVDAA